MENAKKILHFDLNIQSDVNEAVCPQVLNITIYMALHFI